MSAEMIRTEPMTKVFKHWQNLAIGAILLALNVYLVTAASSMMSDATTAIQGWAVLIVGGYAFIAALYLATTTISEHSPLPSATRNTRPLEAVHCWSGALRYRILSH